MKLKIVLYLLYAYILFLYCREELLEKGIHLFVIRTVDWFDTFLLLVGGVVLGMIFMTIGGRDNKRIGAFMIIVNLLYISFAMARAWV